MIELAIQSAHPSERPKLYIPQPKDGQDWSNLVVHLPPLYIQEKVHPKVIIDDLMASDQWRGASHAATSHPSTQATQLEFDLFADFNGIPIGVDKTEFYQHEANWTNGMILGDSLQVMASLLEEAYNTERHLSYVACTRYRDHLLITGVDPASEFLDDLQSSKPQECIPLL